MSMLYNVIKSYNISVTKSLLWTYDLLLSFVFKDIYYLKYSGEKHNFYKNLHIKDKQFSRYITKNHLKYENYIKSEHIYKKRFNKYNSLWNNFIYECFCQYDYFNFLSYIKMFLITKLF